ncbi:XRE family transcriptional regulator [Eggerthella lenta]|uniref:Transcriptional regulator, XRE family n=1 Tax=Eggerthella lenta (strain ATCC 25559 / DSM 2243 / CCUG 17323 / JCM 9979 / KCTC 3265 / NCTC 11813 / VPI 0255 / 1899 B) TaxID=479437 RepID=C8WLT2_EGGLE|nr:helix-turn-helix transcriptional regulator [Eggerthella lenta]ACV56545.1 transcriptional regulator, XRE family [Eggerthella lenta DSM 2243]RDB85195.1 XRE family transcriptional regulator [Eggerthella lenta]RDB87800.1 XRE family transcriptional regulator [Eggerthella lenta]RDC10858.1 XRE family transcriptional regulator [Eggerthella lenta]
MDNRIAALLKERNIKPASFAEMAMIPASTVYAIVNGTTKFDKIGIGTFIKIAKALGMTVEELYFGTYEIDPALSEITATYRQTTPEGKRFMSANAKTVREVYPTDEAKNGGENNVQDDHVSGVA